MPGGQGGAKKKTKAAAGVATATKPKPTSTLAKAAPKRPVPLPPPGLEMMEPELEPETKKRRTGLKKKKSAALPEHIPLDAPSQSAAPLSKAEKEMSVRRKAREAKGFGTPAGPGGAVVYLGHIPHGFYEEQMRGFFSQFGTVCRLRLARNKKARARPLSRTGAAAAL